MAVFKYIGDHDQIVQHDITFVRDHPVDVTGKKIKYRKRVATMNGVVMEDRFIVIDDKLRGNRDFEECLMHDGNEIIPKKRGRPLGSNKGTNQRQSTAQA